MSDACKELTKGEREELKGLEAKATKDWRWEQCYEQSYLVHQDDMGDPDSDPEYETRVHWAITDADSRPMRVSTIHLISLSTGQPHGELGFLDDPNVQLAIAARNAIAPLIQQVERLERSLAMAGEVQLTGHHHWGMQLMEQLGRFVEQTATAATPMTTKIMARFSDVDFPAMHIWATTSEQAPAARCAELAAARAALETAVAGRDKEIASLRQQLAAAEERAKRAEEIVAKLPTTRDGVLVPRTEPDQFLYCPRGHKNAVHRSDVDVYCLGRDGQPCYSPPYQSDGSCGRHWKFEECFSTEAAAQAAKPGACDCGICHGEGLIGNDGQTCPCIIAGCKKRHGRDEYMPSAAKQEGK
jgi:hypothetical protein